MERLVKSKIESGRVAIHWLGQGGFAFKAHSGEALLVDPYLSDSASIGDGATRMADIPIRPKDVRVGYLFLTHDHAAHTDPHTAPVIAQSNPDASIVCPPSSSHHLTKLGVPSSRITTVLPGQSLEFPGFKAHVVAAHHTEDSVGYLFEFANSGSETDAISVYITGDTEYSEGLAAAVAEYGPEVLLLPINGRDGNMNASQAAKITAQIAPREVIPMHYGMFEEDAAEPADFLAYLAVADPDNEITPVVMGHNSCHIYCPEESIKGKHARAEARSTRARAAHSSHQHQDGQRSPGGGHISTQR